MKQGNPQKKMGRVAMIAAAIAGLFSGVGKGSVPVLMKEKSDLLTNRIYGPAPRKILNQRQKRKRARW